jgi:hypothetical protein
VSIFDEDRLAKQDLGPWFTAMFDGDCRECDGPIDEGDQVRYKEGEIVCANCGEDK